MPGDRRLIWQRRLGPWLVPASRVYGAGARLRRWAYGRGLLATLRCDRPVVSVGSLLAGGTGKTPLVRHLAKRFQGRRVAILSRGYGGSYRGTLQVKADTLACVAGDEPVLLARTTGADVWVARNRARLALELSDRYDLFLLDDGFQHLELERFLNICVLPNETPGRLLPSGLWREGPAALSAADLVVAWDAWPDWLDRYYHGPRLIAQRCRTLWQGPTGESRPEGPVFAFCGVARPERFFDALNELDVRGSAAWPDHHPYTDADLDDLEARARRAGAWSLVTTAKDAVRIQPHGLTLPLFWCDLEVRFIQGERELSAFLDEIAPSPR